MEREADVVECHLDVFNDTKDDSNVVTVLFNNPDDALPSQNICKERTTIPVDEDGDPILERVKRFKLNFMPKSKLENVGHTLWNGSVFLSEYIMQSPELIVNKHVIEMGCGQALVAMMAHQLRAQTILATDMEHVLKATQRSLDRNNLAKKVKVIKWNIIDDSFHSLCLSDLPDTILAADLVYDEALTEAIFERIQEIVNSSQKELSVVFAIEKRKVFTVREMKVTTPNFDHFEIALKQFIIKNQRAKVHKVLKADDLKRQALNFRPSEQMVVVHVCIERSVTTLI